MRAVITFAKKLPVIKLLIPLYICIAFMFAVLIRRGNVQLLQPAGYIAEVQSKILWGVIAFAAFLATLTICSFLYVAIHYQEGKRRRYEPNWTPGKLVFAVAWAIPVVFITGVSVVIWNTAHQVDPYQPISSSVSPITVQVVALQWKWLFLYPKDRIATVNTLDIPTGTPINFELTADAPMNSFWIPRLSGQVYAMTGMVTQLHIEADKTGTYAGSPAEISGGDFAGMVFNVNALSPKDYQAWLRTSQTSRQQLDYNAYLQLSKPSGYVTPTVYSLSDQNLFDVVVMKFMSPTTTPSQLNVRGTNI